MRTLLIVPLLALAACDGGYSSAPLAPTVIERKADAAGSVAYVCSVTNEEAALWTLSTGEKLDPIPTGRYCDYEAYRAWREGYGPRPQPNRSPIPGREWLSGSDA